MTTAAIMLAAGSVVAEEQAKHKVCTITTDQEKELKVEIIEENGERIVKIYEIVDGEPKLTETLSGQDAGKFELSEGSFFIFDDDNDAPPHGAHERMMKIIKEKRIVSEPRAFLGIQMEDLSGQLAEYFGGEGVLIKEVIEASPAAESGLKAGDVVVKIDDADIATGEDIVAIMVGHKAGDKVQIKVLRKGKDKSIDVTLAENQTEPVANVWFDKMDGPAKIERFHHGDENARFAPTMGGDEHEILMQRHFRGDSDEIENLKADVAELKAMIEELQKK